MKPLRLLSLALVLLSPALADAAPGPWKIGRPEKLNVRPGKGRTLGTYASPNRRYALVYRNENEVGDFQWRRVYLKQGNRYTLIGSYQTIRTVRWDRASTSVRYRALKAVGPDVLHQLEVVYQPASRVVRSRVLKVEKIQLP